MERTTKNRYLRKRLVRLLKKQLQELDTTVQYSLLSDVDKNIKLVAKVIERLQMNVSQIDDRFIASTLRIANTDEHSHTISKSIITEIIRDILENEASHAHKEYTLELFQIKWVSKTRRRQHHQKRHTLIG